MFYKNKMSRFFRMKPKIATALFMTTATASLLVFHFWNLKTECQKFWSSVVRSCSQVLGPTYLVLWSKILRESASFVCGISGYIEHKLEHLPSCFSSFFGTLYHSGLRRTWLPEAWPCRNWLYFLPSEDYSKEPRVPYSPMRYLSWIYPTWLSSSVRSRACHPLQYDSF